MKHLKTFWQINENLDDYTWPIHYNSGAYSFHLNFDIKEITNGIHFIYPGMEYTTNSSGKLLLEEFAMAIQKYDLEKIGNFFNGEKTHFDQEQQVVTCGTNNFNIREIPYEVWRTLHLTVGPYENNFLNQKAYDLTKGIRELEDNKIYVCFNLTKEYNDLTKDKFREEFTGVIDVTQDVKTFIEKSRNLSENPPVQERYRSYRR